MEIYHNLDQKKIWLTINNKEAFVEYKIKDGCLDIIHTYVPSQLEGQGIAGSLVKYAYEYAAEKGLKPKGTCPYAEAWLLKHNKI